MKEGKNKLRYIVADDFTGANDIGVALASSGLETHVLFAQEDRHEVSESVSIICTDSRDLDADEAKEVVGQLACRYQLADSQPLLIKKVDSTLRGNIGSEIEALLENGFGLAVVAIAAPNAHRKTLGGLCYVNDVPLADTEFASDPKSPINSSRISDILKQQTHAKVEEYRFEDRGDSTHLECLTRLYHSGAKIIVCDAQSSCDLSELYLSTEQLNVPSVFVSTGELTQALFTLGSHTATNLKPTHAPVLGVIGSMSQTTFLQAEYLLEHDIAQVVELELEQLLSQSFETYLGVKANEAIRILELQQNCVIRSCQDLSLRYELGRIAKQNNLSQKQLSEHVRGCLAELASSIVKQLSPKARLGGLILCGGDIAIATAGKLHASSYQIGGIVADCVPWGTLNSDFTPFPIFTKAGGFGDVTTFAQVIQYLNQEVKQ